ncbi:ABC transporter B family member 5 [Colletotrichum fructicola]|nr:ABC transporter B family member 5 [Colletotrichum fructicola]
MAQELWNVPEMRLVLTLLLNLDLKGVGVWAPQALGRVIDGLTYGDTWFSIEKLLIAWFVPQVWELLFRVLQPWMSLVVSAYRGEELDKTVYAKIMTADPSYHASKSSTSLTAAVDRAKGVERSFDSLMGHSFDFLFATCITIPITALKFGQHIMIIMAIRLAVAYLNFRRGTAKSQQATADYIAVDKAHKISREDTIRGWETAAVFRQIAHQIAENDTAVEKVHTAKFQSYLQRVITWAFGLASGDMGHMIGAWLVCSQIFVGTSTPGSLAVYNSYWTQIVNPITSILKSFDEIMNTFQKAAEVAEIIDTVPKEREKRLRFERGAIKFRNVTLSRGGTVVLDNFNLDIAPKKKIALVGRSGTGKSSILGLITGHIEPDRGIVTVDGQDVTKIDFDSLSEHIGILQQNPHIYATTVKENLLIGKRKATIVEIREACVKAQIHDDIERRQGGYETSCGMDGKNFSGGQIQRIAIGRLLLKKPDIALIDEGTSALDAATEGLIKKSFSEVFKNSTVITVAHRLSSIRQADEIIVLGEKGIIVEQGSHDELVKRRGEYWKYWQEHLGKEVASND